MGDDDMVVHGDTSGSSTSIGEEASSDTATSTSGGESTGAPADTTGSDPSTSSTSDGSSSSGSSSGSDESSTGQLCEYLEVPEDVASETTCDAACGALGLQCMEACDAPAQSPAGYFCECC